MAALRTSAPIGREADLKQLLDPARRMGVDDKKCPGSDEYRCSIEV
jgi:hypothetical protein